MILILHFSAGYGQGDTGPFRDGDASNRLACLSNERFSSISAPVGMSGRNPAGMAICDLIYSRFYRYDWNHGRARELSPLPRKRGCQRNRLSKRGNGRGEAKRQASAGHPRAADRPAHSQIDRTDAVAGPTPQGGRSECANGGSNQWKQVRRDGRSIWSDAVAAGLASRPLIRPPGRARARNRVDESAHRSDSPGQWSVDVGETARASHRAVAGSTRDTLRAATSTHPVSSSAARRGSVSKRSERNTETLISPATRGLSTGGVRACGCAGVCASGALQAIDAGPRRIRERRAHHVR